MPLVDDVNRIFEKPEGRSNRRGRMQIALPILGAVLLGLSIEHAIEGVVLTADGDIELLVSGPDLPVATAKEPSPRVEMILRVSPDSSGNLFLEAWWKHAPENKWRIPR